MQGVGHRRCQSAWPDLFVHIPRHTLDGGLPFRYPLLGFVDTLQAGLPETFVLRHTANGVNLPLDICRNEPTVSPHASL